MPLPFSIYRDRNGIPHVDATSEADMYRGQGYAHARDRGMQMLLMRILGQGRASEILEASDEMLAIDTFFRRMNWTVPAPDGVDGLDAGAIQCLEAYCDGINTGLSARRPWEFRLLGYTPEPWTPADSVLMARMVGYLTLAQSQGEIERLFVELVQAGVPREYLDELFPGILGGLDMDLVRSVTLGERIVPPEGLWQLAVPRMMASNNWVVAGTRTASGKPILANDPHLEINRLPCVWYEVVLSANDRSLLGASMPGLPGVLVGRNPNVAWGVTYAFVDALDSWVEACRDGCYHRTDTDRWLPFNTRREVIRRKKKTPVEVVFYENDHGVLDGDPHQEGRYLATRWAAGDGGVGLLGATFAVFAAHTVEEAMDILKGVESAWNFVLADTRGDIGYQMTGRTPRRREGVSGFVPLAGWDPANDWQGFVDPGEMPRALNPEDGFIATANEDLNHLGQASPITICMGDYRAERIRSLLREGERLTAEDMMTMHGDLFSLQAERFMAIIAPLLPDTPTGEILRSWDLRYDAESRGAFLFECIYRELYREVFGRQGIGEKAVDFLQKRTGIFIDFYLNFDRVLLAENSLWFGGRTREAVYRAAMDRALATAPRAWGEARTFMLSHLIFGGKLPALFGFDRGPIVGIGGRATIHQGQIYTSGDRLTTFFPSYRFVTDMAGETARTNLIGGPSDRRFSRWYVTDVENWRTGRYKHLDSAAEEKLPFP